MGSLEQARAVVVSVVKVKVHCEGCFRVVRLTLPPNYYAVKCPSEGCHHHFYADVKVVERS